MADTGISPFVVGRHKIDSSSIVAMARIDRKRGTIQESLSTHDLYRCRRTPTGKWGGAEAFLSA
jgi:hypothetical protein